jgi:hypothetical protein
MREGEEIFVRLPDEAVEVWRPVQARNIGDDRYLILEQPYDREGERWEFEPGAEVTCAVVRAEAGEILAAVEASDARGPR